MWRLGLIIFVTLTMAACGGLGGKNLTPATPIGGTTAAPTAGTTAAPTSNAQGSPTPVNVSAGQAATGVDVTVTSLTSVPNAEDLGANVPSARGSASNTGSRVHRGSTMRVILFGTGLNAGMKVIVAGPSDLTVSSVTGIQATDNTTGVAFNVSVSSDAALGIRTVYLQNPNGETTSFTGGLEIIP